jgi:phosphatidylglycerophosphate synthase
MSSEKLSISDLRAKGYPIEKKQYDDQHFGHGIRRTVDTEIALRLAFIFLKFGATANQVTGLSILLSLLSCGLFITGKVGLILLAAIGFYAVDLLDSVDGIIARYSGTASRYGKYIDDLSGTLSTVLLFTSIGIGLYISGGDLFSRYCFDNFPYVAFIFAPNLFLFLGPFESLMGLLRTFISLRYLQIMEGDNEEILNSVMTQGRSKTVFSVAVAFFMWKIPLVVLCALFNVLSIVLYFYAAVASLFVIYTILISLLSSNHS